MDAGCFFPPPLLKLRIGLKSLSFLKKGLGSLRKGRLEVEVLDAAAITASILRGDFGTAGSVMMLLETGRSWCLLTRLGRMTASISIWEM